jgi:hypothetical protein
LLLQGNVTPSLADLPSFAPKFANPHRSRTQITYLLHLICCCNCSSMINLSDSSGSLVFQPFSNFNACFPELNSPKSISRVMNPEIEQGTA